MPRDVYAVSHTLYGDRTYAGTVVFTYRVEYPQFVTFTSMPSITRINTYYKENALALVRFAQETYYPEAVEDYKNRQDENYPFTPYELQRPFTITYGHNCFVSLYLDEYVYTGGAHGMTTRTSDTWDARSGRRIALADLFPQGYDYEEVLIQLINEEIALRVAQDEGTYFDNYPELTKEYFDPQSFYLTPDALTIYYQQIEIAPYSTGIPTFAFPYALVGATLPGC